MPNGDKIITIYNTEESFNRFQKHAYTKSNI